ncbi:Muconate cycloisomerase 1 [Psilocybe cubensis]|uniref:Isomerase YbhE n=2 Tax=Psilocybe cubensis TaxID=181762 RepID=A0A8H7XWH7_PSICU|nr:Muconate cycloisomerase 1 [Psilocybe cubensis]KAH9475999.1 Muconate cycloisomerase 1 [Psilocybe cubensis]
MEAQNVLHYPQAINSSVAIGNGAAAYIHILSGSFKSLSLFLLAFSPSKRSLAHLATIPAYGPHQYLCTNREKDHVYTTSWALPPSLSSWHIERSETEPWKVKHINTVPITATSSYITIPQPYTHAYSVGGPTGESHSIDATTGALINKTQEILFVPEDQLEAADKTRVALRYGSHGIEFTPSGQYAFVPVLGTNSIEMYTRDPASGQLEHITSVPSPRGLAYKDGPRHVKIHPNGKVLYSITEHSNLVDAYRILPNDLEHMSSRSLLPTDAPVIPTTHSEDHFRGDTLMFPPSTPSKPAPTVLITTTRGSNSRLRGWLSVFPLDADGDFTSVPEDVSSENARQAERFQTPTSGGRANAIDIISKDNNDPNSGLWILLTDEDDFTVSPSGTGAVRVLEWDGWGKGGIKIVDEWPTAKDADGEYRIKGASHAIWLD